MPPAKNAVSGGKGKRGKRLGVSVSEHKLLLRLCKAIESQTEAISALARSNEALVASLIEDGEGAGSESLGDFHPHL